MGRAEGSRAHQAVKTTTSYIQILIKINHAYKKAKQLGLINKCANKKHKQCLSARKT